MRIDLNRNAIGHDRFRLQLTLAVTMVVTLASVVISVSLAQEVTRNAGNEGPKADS